MKKESIKIGKIDGELIFLYKHTWDCDWYWGMGYIGNRNLHTHISSLINEKNSKGNYPSTEIKDIFEQCELTQKQWWVVRDLFIQAYALKEVAEVYHYGGHQTTLKGVTDIINSKEKENQCNADLKIILDTVWEYINTSIKENKEITE